MNTEQTCGKGLAENSPLPRKLGELSASMAEILELHMNALDRGDDGSARERAAYAGLAKEHRAIAVALLEAAQQMAGYRDLPMGAHDPEAMSAPEAREAFEKFVRREEELLALLQRRLEQDLTMLAAMGKDGR